MNDLPHEKKLQDIVKAIDQLKQQSKGTDLFLGEIKQLENKLHELKEETYRYLTPWQRVTICSQQARPHALDYIQVLSPSFMPLSGDRHFADDPAIIGGLGQIGDIKCMIIGQEKGHDTQSRLAHNFGMPSPEGYRKAKRLMLMAEKFNLPVISLIDTPGANPILEAEERGQGSAIAENLKLMSRLKVPIIVIIIGEGCSGGALGIAIGDAIGMLEHAYYSVISPEGCASILWEDSSKKEDAAQKLCLTAEDMLRFGVIDKIIEEPLGGAHHQPDVVYAGVKNFIAEQYAILQRIPEEDLIEQRYQKFRKLGKYISL